MYPVSDIWKEANEEYLAPEGLVELSCYIPELNETLVYTKKDLLSFTHQQTGCLISGELPKNHIEFTLDNSDDKWNPNNPTGMAKHLSERLKIILRYGFIIDGVERWIPGGIFYLSEWRVSSNGLEASFSARDVLEFMIDRPYTGRIEGSLCYVVRSVLSEANLPVGDSLLGEIILGETPLGSVEISKKRLGRFFVNAGRHKDNNDPMAIILQKCANAAGCVMYQGRDGLLRIGPLSYQHTGYTILRKLSYSHPEIEFSRPIKDVSVAYGSEAAEVYHFTDTGESQTLNNEYITTRRQAAEIASWVCESLLSRRKISGEFRGDPRFDLFDVVNVETKYGEVVGVVLTDIKCTFNGAFRISYSGYVRGSDEASKVYSGDVYSGEVV